MKRSRWLDEQNKKAELDSLKSNNKAFFGYERIPEDEKAHWVMRHFDSIAQKYDFMNTLLSFGIHYLWKRAA